MKLTHHNKGTCGYTGWGWASRGYNPKVISRFQMEQPETVTNTKSRVVWAVGALVRTSLIYFSATALYTLPLDAFSCFRTGVMLCQEVPSGELAAG